MRRYCWSVIGIRTCLKYCKLFSAVRSVHQYSFGKTVFAVILTIAAIFIMLFLMVLFMSLIQQIYIFISTVYTELSYRMRS